MNVSHALLFRVLDDPFQFRPPVNVCVSSLVTETKGIFYVLCLWFVGPERDEGTGVWRTLHNEELLDLYSSPTTVRVIKSRRMRWAGHVAWNGGEERRVKGFGGET
jgi:hypothetical protein